MATAPVKPQQLHNFPLSLKWGQTTTTASSGQNNNRRHIPAPASTLFAAPESETESEPEPNARPTHRVGSRSARLHRFSFPTPCTTLLKRPSQEAELAKKVTALDDKKEGEAAEEEEEELEEEVEEKGKQGDEEDGGQNGNLRPWKLRPRKGGFFKEVMQMSNNEQKEGKNNNCNSNMTSFQAKSARLRGLVESSGGGGEVDKKEKLKFWIALSREEIEEDVFIMTGSRPARRPRKRAKNVQKVLDSVFPGLWLVGATADSFGVADAPVKK